MSENLNSNQIEEENGSSTEENDGIFHDWLRKIDPSFYKEINYHKNGTAVLVINIVKLIPLLTFLRDDNEMRFKILADLFGVDYVWNSKWQKRFSVLYNLLSMRYNRRIFLQVFLDEDEEIPSCHEIFNSATWLQREVFDMFGIRFKDAMDHRRILTDYGFQHFPLRKDFPLTGYDEVRYNTETEAVEYSPVELDQDFRNFNFETSWECLPGDEKAN